MNENNSNYENNNKNSHINYSWETLQMVWKSHQKHLKQTLSLIHFTIELKLLELYCEYIKIFLLE